jgi:hypothetical protein
MTSMRSYRSSSIAALTCVSALAFLSLMPRLNGQTTPPGMQPAADSERILGAFADAVAPRAPASALQTFASTYNATVTQGPKGPIAKHGLTFLSASTAVPDSSDASPMAAANCKDKCPGHAMGTYKNKLGNWVTYDCTGLDGCSYDPNLKKWKCTYRSCSFFREGTIIPQ